ncbi:MAG: DUF2752 domain-containing protein [Ferruginibacter sp.]|nr:DUF2752 domain-containing protein [Ferruginibacter sp.]
MQKKNPEMITRMNKNFHPLSPPGNSIKKWMALHFELIFWITGICLLFFMNAAPAQPSLCFFRFIGLDSCPGCGIGHSIHHALHLRFAQSVQEHIAGIPAVLIILFRIKQLSYPKKTTVYEV